jgi:serine/threonine-protein kinase
MATLVMDDPQSQKSPVNPGDILARKYRVEKVLGVGGMGVVVAAMHTELDERVALKFLLPAAAQNPSIVARFNREARAAVKIKSQHVARVSDVGTLDDGTPYIVMEYLEGKDLGDLLLDHKQFPFGVAIDYVLQACEAIAEAHAAGIVHRDLKPPNLFLARQADGTAIVKVLDFGISKAVLVDEPSGNHGGITGTTDVFGSPTYMSPEQLKASRDVDARTDVWSLGVILYELIAGKAPFERPTVAETFGSILYEQPVPLRKLRPDVPPQLEQVIMRCLEKEVAARTPNISELSKALFPFAANGSQASLDRTARILKRAGMTHDSASPQSHLLAASARTSIERGSAPGSQTRSAWGTGSQIPRPRGSRSTVLIGAIAGMIVAGGAGFLMLRRIPPTTVVVPMQAERPSPPAPLPAAAPTPPVVTATPGGEPAAAAVPAPTAPATAASATPTATVATLPTTPATTATTATRPGAKPVRVGKRGANSTAAAPDGPPPVVAPPKPPEGDDFGDRK